MNTRAKLLIGFTTITTMALFTANIAAAKIWDVFGITPGDGGIIVFPITYIIGDLLVEFYGEKTANKVSLFASAVSLLAILSLMIVVLLPAHPEYIEGGKAFDMTFAFSLRITIASLIAYLLSRATNNWQFMKIKREQWKSQVMHEACRPDKPILIKAAARRLRELAEDDDLTLDEKGAPRYVRGYHLRELGSSVIGRLVDNVIFETIAFIGVLSMQEFWKQLVTAYLEGIIVEVALILTVAGPLRYLCHKYLTK